MTASYCSCGRRRGRWWIEKMLSSAMSSHFALFEVQLGQQVLAQQSWKSYAIFEVSRWKNCHRSAAPPSIFSSTSTLPPSVSTTSCSPYSITCKTNSTTPSFSSCNKCIRNRSKFLLPELFYILIQLKSQLNKLKRMLLFTENVLRVWFCNYAWIWASN